MCTRQDRKLTRTATYELSRAVYKGYRTPLYFILLDALASQKEFLESVLTTAPDIIVKIGILNDKINELLNKCE